MQKNIVIIHYNTPHMTECLVMSINKFVDNAKIYIFDNSDSKPFTAKYDNVTILDNTSGQIIDFQSWLEKYPNRLKSNGKTNNAASAKHAYSVEKCMEIINENFILMDSDILIKQDISPLFRDDAIYVGETIIQPKSSIKRVLPYLCFINTEMCKKHNIHYFNDDYMHGLYKTAIADRYDTGAGFYKTSIHYPHIDITIEDYAIHYGHGSWEKPGYTKTQTDEEWLMSNQSLWSDKPCTRKAIYTCITGAYDALIEPEYLSPGWDYICFTDNPELTSNIWKIKPLPMETEGLSQVKKQRFVKINPHITLPDYDISVWVDGNVNIKGNLNEFLAKHLIDGTSVYVPKHPARNCIYDESKVVLAMRKDKKEIVEPQMERYKNEGFPKDYGLLQSNILLRRHNEPDCIRLMEAWFNELKNNSHRDQLSFNYALWKNEDVKVSYMDKKICYSEYFNWNGRHKRAKTATPTPTVQSRIITPIKRYPSSVPPKPPVKNMEETRINKIEVKDRVMQRMTQIRNAKTRLYFD